MTLFSAVITIPFKLIILFFANASSSSSSRKVSIAVVVVVVVSSSRVQIHLFWAFISPMSGLLTVITDSVKFQRMEQPSAT
jgi:hypothetical protein